jgi:hypothetical protein
MEKICYAVVLSTRKLGRYFEAHRVRVLTNQPLNDIFGYRDSSGRFKNWAMELSEHLVDLEKRCAIKSQLLANFIAYWMEPSSYTVGTVVETPWQVHCDGAWGVSRVGVAVILMSPTGIKLRYTIQLWFTAEKGKCSNNIAEYEAVLLGLCKL